MMSLSVQQKRQTVLEFKTATLEAAKTARSAVRQRLSDVERFKFAQSNLPDASHAGRIDHHTGGKVQFGGLETSQGLQQYECDGQSNLLPADSSSLLFGNSDGLLHGRSSPSSFDTHSLNTTESQSAGILRSFAQPIATGEILSVMDSLPPTAAADFAMETQCTGELSYSTSATQQEASSTSKSKGVIPSKPLKEKKAVIELNQEIQDESSAATITSAEAYPFLQTTGLGSAAIAELGSALSSAIAPTTSSVILSSSSDGAFSKSKGPKRKFSDSVKPVKIVPGFDPRYSWDHAPNTNSATSTAGELLYGDQSGSLQYSDAHTRVNFSGKSSGSDSHVSYESVFKDDYASFPINDMHLNEVELDDQRASSMEETNFTPNRKINYVRALQERRAPLAVNLAEIESSKFSQRRAVPTTLRSAIKARKPGGKAKELTANGAEAAGGGELEAIYESAKFTNSLFLKPKGHWDFLLEEMQWMAVDFKQELRWKLAACRAASLTCRGAIQLSSVVDAADSEAFFRSEQRDCIRWDSVLSASRRAALFVADISKLADRCTNDDAAVVTGSGTSNQPDKLGMHSLPAVIQMPLTAAELNTPEASIGSRCGISQRESDLRGIARAVSQLIDSHWSEFHRGMFVQIAEDKDVYQCNAGHCELIRTLCGYSAEIDDACGDSKPIALAMTSDSADFMQQSQLDDLGKHDAGSALHQPLHHPVLESTPIVLHKAVHDLLTYPAHSSLESAQKQIDATATADSNAVADGSGERWSSNLLPHQLFAAEKAAALNMRGYGAYLHGPFGSGKVQLIAGLLQKWRLQFGKDPDAFPASAINSIGMDPVRCVYLFTPRQSELLWLVHLQDAAAEFCESAGRIFPVLWGSSEAAEGAYHHQTIDIHNLSLRVVIVPFEEYLCSNEQLIDRADIATTSIITGQLKLNRLLLELRNAFGVIMDCDFEGSTDRYPSVVSFPHSPALGAPTPSTEQALPIPLTISRAKRILDLLAVQLPGSMRNRSVVSSHSLFSDCVDFFSSLAFLIPGSSRTLWCNRYSAVDETLSHQKRDNDLNVSATVGAQNLDAGTSDAVTVSDAAATGESGCSVGDTGSNSFAVDGSQCELLCGDFKSFRGLSISQENRNVLCQMSTNLSICIDIPFIAPNRITEEFIAEPMPPLQYLKYCALERSFFGDTIAFSGESAGQLARALTLLRCACFHGSLLALRDQDSDEINACADADARSSAVDRSCWESQASSFKAVGAHPASSHRASSIAYIPRSSDQGKGCLVTASSSFIRAARCPFASCPNVSATEYVQNTASPNAKMPEDCLYSQVSCKLSALLRLLRDGSSTTRVVILVESFIEQLVVHRFLNSFLIAHSFAGDPQRTSREEGTARCPAGYFEVRQWTAAQAAVRHFNRGAGSERILLARSLVFSAQSLMPTAADEVIVLSECWVYRCNAANKALRRSFVLPLLSEKKHAGEQANPRIVKIRYVIAANSIEERLYRSGKSFLRLQGSSASNLTAATVLRLNYQSERMLAPTATQNDPTMRESESPSLLVGAQGDFFSNPRGDGASTYQRFLLEEAPLLTGFDPPEDQDSAFQANTFFESGMQSNDACSTAELTSSSCRVTNVDTSANMSSIVISGDGGSGRSTTFAAGRGKGMIALSATGQTVFVRNDSESSVFNCSNSNGSTTQSQIAYQAIDISSSKTTRVNMATVLQHLHNFDVLGDEALMSDSFDSKAKQWLRELAVELSAFEENFFSAGMIASQRGVGDGVVTYHLLGAVYLGAHRPSATDVIKEQRIRQSAACVGAIRRRREPVIRIIPRAALDLKRNVALTSHQSSNSAAPTDTGSHEVSGQYNIASPGIVGSKLYSAGDYATGMRRTSAIQKSETEDAADNKSIFQTIDALHVCLLNHYYRAGLHQLLHQKHSSSIGFPHSEQCDWLLDRFTSALIDFYSWKNCPSLPSSPAFCAFTEQEKMRLTNSSIVLSSQECGLRDGFYERLPVDGTGFLGSFNSGISEVHDIKDRSMQSVHSSNLISKHSLAELERSRNAATNDLAGYQTSAAAFTSAGSWPSSLERFREVTALLGIKGVPVDNCLYVNPLNTAHLADAHFDCMPALHGSNSAVAALGLDSSAFLLQIVLPQSQSSVSRSQVSKRHKPGEVAKDSVGGGGSDGGGTTIAAVGKEAKPRSIADAVSGNRGRGSKDSGWDQADTFVDNTGAVVGPPPHSRSKPASSGSSRKRPSSSSSKARPPKRSKVQHQTQGSGGGIASGHSVKRTDEQNANTALRPLGSSSAASDTATSSSVSVAAAAAAAAEEAASTEFVEWRAAEDDIIICMQNSVHDVEFTHTENWLNQSRQANTTAPTFHRKRTAEEARRRYEELCNNGQKDARLKDRNVQSIIQKLKTSTKK